MIEVRIRYEDDAEARMLMEVAEDKLDTIIPLIARWGLYTHDESWIVPERLSGQFCYTGQEAFFEIRIDPES